MSFPRGAGAAPVRRPHALEVSPMVPAGAGRSIGEVMTPRAERTAQIPTLRPAPVEARIGPGPWGVPA